MKIVVIGGTGLIGTKLVHRLREKDQDVLAASPATGVDVVTGKGLAGALAGARVVVDVADSPSFEDVAVLEFFQTVGRNLLAAERAAGVGHHVALSAVGADRLPHSGYMRAKAAQEQLIKAASVPYTIVRATQFFEFLADVASAATVGDTVHLPSALIQPVAADEVAAALAEATLSVPVNGTIELAGPAAMPLDEAVRRYLDATGDNRKVTSGPNARYFGTELSDASLTPGDDPRLGTISLTEWLRRPSDNR